MPLLSQTLMLDSITAKCDGCKAVWRAGWPTREQALRGLDESGWYYSAETQTVYCPACIKLAMPDTSHSA